MIECQRRHIIKGKPCRPCCVVGSLDILYADKGVIGHRDDPCARVAVGVAEGVKLFDAHIGEPRFFLKLAKGYRGARSKQYRIAKQSVMRAMASAFAGRKQRKRDMRALWITRINAAARMNGISYSKFIFGLKKAGIELNRKVLAEIAINDAAGFTKLVDAAKAQIA